MKIGENIIVVEFGGDKIVALAANCRQFGRFELIAKEEEPSNGSIVRGVIQDTKVAGEKLYNMVLKLNVKLQQEHLPKISDIYVLINGWSLRSIVTEELRHIDPDDVVVEGDIESFESEEEFKPIKGEKCYERLHLGYFLDEVRDDKPIGKKCKTLSKATLNIIGAKKIEEQLRQSFIQVGGMVNIHLLLRPEALKKMAFKGQEIIDYAAIVDMGSTTTGVAIFNNSGMVYYEVIPLGSNNITRDIASFGIPYDQAERLKIEKGSAKLDLMSKNEILVESINLNSHKLHLAIEARMSEILLNVKEVINRSSIQTSELSEGILFTGGGSLIKDFNKVCHQVFPGVAVRKMPIGRTAFFNEKEIDVFTAEYTSLLGAIILGAEAPGGTKIEKESTYVAPTSELFAPTALEPTPTAPTPESAPVSEIKIPVFTESTDAGLPIEEEDSNDYKPHWASQTTKEETSKREGNSFFGMFGGRDKNKERNTQHKQEQERERQREEERLRLKTEEDERRQRQENERRQLKEAEEAKKRAKDEAAKQSREKFAKRLTNIFSEDDYEK